MTPRVIPILMEIAPGLFAGMALVQHAMPYKQFKTTLDSVWFIINEAEPDNAKVKFS